MQSTSAATEGPVERAVAEIADIVARLLDELPERRQPPATVPPLRRPEVRARLGLGAVEDEHDHPHDHDHPHPHPHEHVHA